MARQPPGRTAQAAVTGQQAVAAGGRVDTLHSLAGGGQTPDFLGTPLQIERLIAPAKGQKTGSGLKTVPARPIPCGTAHMKGATAPMPGFNGIDVQLSSPPAERRNRVCRSKFYEKVNQPQAEEGLQARMGPSSPHVKGRCA